MRQRWQSLCDRIGIGRETDAVYQDLVNRYTAHGRAYHNLEHIAFCLRELDAARDLAVHADAVEMAIWFHDAVYDTRSSKNEKRSAALARERLRSIGAPDDLITEVQRLILATAHTAPPQDADDKLIVDVDLAILGQTAEVFDQCERRIRQEYAWVPETVFWQKRGEILQRFLDRPTIFKTPEFIDKYEQPARANLERSIRNHAD